MYRYLTPDDRSAKDWEPPVSWFVSRVLWREVATRLEDQPELLEQSRHYIERALETGQFSCSRVYVERWQEILEGGLESVKAVLCSNDDDRSQVLRSCSPFPLLKALSQHERDDLRQRVRNEVLLFRRSTAPR